MSLKAACFCLLRLKIRETTEKLETISGSSHNYDLSNNTTYGHTQTGATVPLSKGYKRIYITSSVSALRATVHDLVLCYGPQCRIWFHAMYPHAMWATARNQIWDWLESDLNQIFCVSSALAMYKHACSQDLHASGSIRYPNAHGPASHLGGCASTFMWLCIHRHVVIYAYVAENQNFPNRRISPLILRRSYNFPVVLLWLILQTRVPLSPSPSDKMATKLIHPTVSLSCLILRWPLTPPTRDKLVKVQVHPIVVLPHFVLRWQ
jgi:hypothetical protein